MKDINLKKPVKIVAVIGSPRGGGNTDALVRAAAEKAQKLGADITYIELRKLKYRGCIACEKCSKSMKCVLKDDLKDLYKTIEEAQGLILGSPTYYYSVTSIMKAFLERLYPYQVYSSKDRHKWEGAMAKGVPRFAVAISVGEQSDEKATGYTCAIMANTLKDIGYSKVDTIAFTDVSGKKDASKSKEALSRAADAGEKLMKSCLKARKKDKGKDK